MAASECSVDLIPGDGSGDRRALPTAQGVDTDRRLVLLVLAPIHQYPALTVLASHVGYHELRVVGFHSLGEVERERLRVGVGDLGVERNVEMKTLGARDLGQQLKAEPLTMLAQPTRHVEAFNQASRRARVEVEDDRGRVVYLVFTGQRDVQLERSQVGGPQERR